MLIFLLPSCSAWTESKETEFSVATDQQSESDSELDNLPIVFANIESDGVVICQNPSVRDETPMVIAEFGSDWSNQPMDGYSPEEGFWYGGEGIVVEDFNQDGRFDIFVPTIDRNLLFIQKANGSFDEQFSSYFGDDSPVNSVGASVADFDGDDDLDLFLLNLVDPHQLFENRGGSFVDVSEERGIVQDPTNVHYSPGSTWGDPDSDGDLDLLVLATGEGPNGPPPWEGADGFVPAGSNQFYLNDFGEEFTLDPLDNHTPEPYSCCAAFIDANLDYKQDLYIVNDFGMYVNPNQLFYGNGEGELVPNFGSGLDVGMYGMGLAVGAFNGDSYPDFVVSDWGRNWLFLSDGFGGWYDATQQWGFVSQQDDQYVGWGVELSDVDNDGDLDIWVGHGQLGLEPEAQEGFDEAGFFDPRYQPDSLFLQENGQLIDVADVWGINQDTITRGGVWADLNNDGFLDLVVSAIDGPVQAYLASCDDSSWIRIQLRQPETMNTRAIGARIKVTTEDGKQLRWILAGSSLSSSGPLEAHFGLGDADVIREIQIIWPDETKSILTDVDINQIVTITRE